jgi:hypothetical protein
VSSPAAGKKDFPQNSETNTPVFSPCDLGEGSHEAKQRSARYWTGKLLMKRSVLWIAMLSGCWLTAPQCQAGIMTYTSQATFSADVSSLGYVSQVATFDSEVVGTIIPSGSANSGITFGYSFGGPQIKVSDLYSTTSGANFLGTDDGSDLLQDGDDFSMSFGARTAIGLYLISVDTLFNGDFTLTVGGSTAFLDAGSVQQTLSDGSSVYFLGLIDDSSTFTSASLSTHGGGGAFTYNVDDIITANDVVAVPEPTSALLFASMTAALWGVSRRRSMRTLAKAKTDNCPVEL